MKNTNEENEIGELIQEETSKILNPLIKADRLEIFKRMKALNVIGNTSKYFKEVPELVEYIGYCHLLLGNIYPKYIEPFQRKNKKKANPKAKKELTPLERKLFDFCQKKNIDLSKFKGNSIDRIHYEAEAKGFKNLKGKKKLVRSTVGKMLAKIRP